MIDRGKIGQSTYNCLLATTIGGDLGAEIEPCVTLYLGTGGSGSLDGDGTKSQGEECKSKFHVGQWNVGDFCFVVKYEFLKKSEG